MLAFSKWQSVFLGELASVTKVILSVASAFKQSSSGVSIIYQNLLLPFSFSFPQSP